MSYRHVTAALRDFTSQILASSRPPSLREVGYVVFPVKTYGNKTRCRRGAGTGNKKNTWKWRGMNFEETRRVSPFIRRHLKDIYKRIGSAFLPLLGSVQTVDTTLFCFVFNITIHLSVPLTQKSSGEFPVGVLAGQAGSAQNNRNETLGLRNDDKIGHTQNGTP